MIDQSFIVEVERKFRQGKSIRKRLPEKGKLLIDQQVPYVCVYRYSGKPDEFLSSLLKTQAAYILAEETVELSGLMSIIMEAGMDIFKSFMVVEIWGDEKTDAPNVFQIRHPQGKVSAVIDVLEKELAALSSVLPRISVEKKSGPYRGPADMVPLLHLDEVQNSGVLWIGIVVPPIFRDAHTRATYPMFFRKIQVMFSEILKRTAFELIRGKDTKKFLNYQMLGKTRLDNLIRSADRSIAAIDEKMNFLLSVTPVNSTSEWERFKQNQFEKTPRFRYRLISIDPELEKRKLFQIPLERIDHTTLAFLLRDKRTELEKQLLMLEERGTRKFFHTSQSIYGDLESETVRIARHLLEAQLPGAQSETENINASDFAQVADAELGKYRKLFPQIDLRVKIKESVSGLLVSGPELSIGKDLNISTVRVNPLIQHEVGTHMLTYCNGHVQPLHLMYSGFAGYEQLQEGLAVLSEFLVGGLNVNRLRLLAARVVAVHALIDGADFIECFRLLHSDYHFSAKTAYGIAVRVFRGGGFTKDAIYLKGLLQVLHYIQEGGDLSHLYAGKYALEHLPLIDELRSLNILKEPVLPDFLSGKEAKGKIKQIRAGMNLEDLVA